MAAPPVRTPFFEKDGRISWSWLQFFIGLGAPSVTIGVISSATPEFDAAGSSAAVITFEYTLTSNAVATLTGVSEGQIIIFVLSQNAVGGWTFTWPTQVKNAGVVDGTALAKNKQAFSVDSDGNLTPISAMTVN